MKRSVLTFYLAAFATTWLLQLPALLAVWGVVPGPFERFMPLLGLSALGPTFAAVLAAHLEGGAGGVRALFRPLRRWRVGAGWYVVALGATGAAFVAGMALYTLLGGRDGGPWFYVPHQAATLTAAVVFSFGEEVGWRGFAFPRLQARHGAVAASAIVGALWCLWHAPMFVLSGFPLWMLAAMVPFFVAGSVLFAWIFNRTGGSLLLAVLAHVGAHLDNSNKALPGNVTPVLVHTVALCALAVALVRLDPKAWRPPFPSDADVPAGDLSERPPPA
jgi:membrane protease YdiL (CAAX protease family)